MNKQSQLSLTQGHRGGKCRAGSQTQICGTPASRFPLLCTVWARNVKSSWQPLGQVRAGFRLVPVAGRGGWRWFTEGHSHVATPESLRAVIWLSRAQAPRGDFGNPAARSPLRDFGCGGTEEESFELRQSGLGLCHGDRFKGKGKYRGDWDSGVGWLGALDFQPRALQPPAQPSVNSAGEKAAESQWKEPMWLSDMFLF